MGKTEVSRILRELGIPVFDADAEVHALYDSTAGGELLRPLAPQAVSRAGKVDREVLSRLVLDDPDLLGRIEAVVHAEILRRRLDFQLHAEKQGHTLAVVDVPLLFEKGGEKDVDVTIVVSASAALQRKRALSRPGMTAAKFEMILGRQMPDAVKRKRADYVIENDGTLKGLRERTLAVLEKIKQGSQQ